MTPRRVRNASRMIAAADAAILAWGVLALFPPLASSSPATSTTPAKAGPH